MKRCNCCQNRCSCCKNSGELMCGFCTDASEFERSSHIEFCPDIGVPVRDIDRSVIIVGNPEVTREDLAKHIHEFLESSGGLTHEEIAL